MSDHIRPRHKIVKICSSCGGRMSRSWQQEEFTYDGVSLVYGQPGWFCEDCPEYVMVGKDMNPGDRAMEAALAWVGGER